jgi:LuxR family transcriptional regulator, maltose regulon positive regulatory protein
VAEDLRQIASSSDASPLIRLSYMVRLAELHDWVHSTWQETYERLWKTMGIAEEVGAYIHLGMVYFHGIVIAFELGNIELVGDFLRRIEQTGFSAKKAFSARTYAMRALYHLNKNDLTAALRDATDGVRAAIEVGMYIPEAYSRVTLAYVLRHLQRHEEALVEVERAESILRRLDDTHVLYLARLARASLCLDRGNLAEGHGALNDAFRIGREKGYAFTLYWFCQPDEMARLCAEALRAGIEVEYAKEVIRDHNLVPHVPLDQFGAWPWPYRIHTLGRFEIVADDAPLTLTGKVQKKPLALLKALISMGGSEVRQEAIEDRLWPEAEGDMARIAFKTNLSRLRKVLGEKAIEVKDGKVSLNKRLVWLDLWALDSLADRLSGLKRDGYCSTPTEEIEGLAQLALNLYHGDYLASDSEPWIDAARERFRTRFARIVQQLSRMFAEAGDEDKAAALYEQAVELGVPSTAMSRFLLTRT